MIADRPDAHWNSSDCCKAAKVRWHENMTVSGSCLCEGSGYIFLTFWVLLGQAKSTKRKIFTINDHSSFSGENESNQDIRLSFREK